jgi:phosphate transport system ATP-binding protein
MNQPTLSNNANPNSETEIVLKVEKASVFYGNFLAVRDVSLEIPKHNIIAFIGPSGCGKSTLLRCFNRMNDLVTGARVEGKISFYGEDLYQEKLDPIGVRRKIGMVFQQPNPFPKSIYENIAYGARVNGYRENMNELVERSLRRAFLWEEVKDKLKESGLSLSGGQQQRLCIARAISKRTLRGRPRTRSLADGRTLFGSRSDFHSPNRTITVPT